MAELIVRKLVPLTAEQLERYWAKVARHGPEDCWLWTGALAKGYGLIRISGQGFYAHRLAWFLEYGNDPGALLACHKCDERKCCNPRHIFLGTAADNIHDCQAKGRFPMGDDHYSRRHPERVRHGAMLHQTKLTEDAVRAIRQLHATGAYTYSALEALFAMGRHTLHAVVHRRIWKHVDGQAAAYEQRTAELRSAGFSV